MKLSINGREYWYPELEAAPPGTVAVRAQFDAGAWVAFDTVDGKQAVLIAGPSVDTATYAHPAGTVVLPVGRVVARVMLVGPGSKEILVRPAGVVDVE